ncbi:MAG TPA: hypothetical protein VIM73_22715 [Polyangiaceae bacterium]
MNSTLMAAAISGILLGGAGVASADQPSNSIIPSVSSSAQQLDDKGKHSCKGKNACKGQGGCKTETHACKGQNACKGQGGCKG